MPNKRFGGVTLGGKIAPIFFNTQEDSGALPIEVDVSKLEMGDVIDIYPYDGKIVKNGETVATSSSRARCAAGRSARRWPHQPGSSAVRSPPRRANFWPARPTAFRLPQAPGAKAGFTLAQKMVGRACGLPEGQGRPPRHLLRAQDDHRGQQDTTGPMTRDELKDLACLGFRPTW